MRRDEAGGGGVATRWDILETCVATRKGYTGKWHVATRREEAGGGELQRERNTL
jgi:hypothetical protein